jgi:uncharacterized protein involved in exopolysaccharide biosynthesis/Mrp family chromosome partitioning ATPase
VDFASAHRNSRVRILMSFEKAPPHLITRPLRIHETAPLAAEDAGADIATSIAAVRRHWFFVLASAAAMSALAVTYLLFTPPVYSAVVQLLLEFKTQPIGTNEPVFGMLSSDSAASFADSQIRILGSEPVLRRVIESEQLLSDPEFASEQHSLLPPFIRSPAAALGLIANDPKSHQSGVLRNLRQAIRIERAGKALVIDVMASSHDPDKSARLANALSEAYVAEQASVREEAARQTVATLTARLAGLRDEVREAEEKVLSYKFQHNTVTPAPNDLLSLPTNRALVGLRELERNADAARTTYQSMLARARQAAADAAPWETSARVISAAESPNRRSWPPARLILGMSLLAGLGMGIGVVLARDSFDRKLYTRRQLNACSGHPVIGVIPRLKRAAFVPQLLWSLAASKQPTVDEHFFRLWDALRGDELGRASTIVLVTSCGPGEGKSTLALNLALAATLDGERVLLIDADVKQRALSRHLATNASNSGTLKQAVAFGEIPKGRGTLDAFVTFPTLPRLVMQPTASADWTGSGLDRSALSQRLFSNAKDFTVVIIDSGSIQSDRFVRSLAAVAQKILIVVRAGRTGPEDLHLGVEILGDASARIYGIVLNEAES